MSETTMIQTADRAVRLQDLEYRISVHIRGAYENMLEVGWCLNAAKDHGLVPYGQWEAWVEQQTGMSARSAQRVMRAAREVTPGSVMAQLPITKIQAILALPEAEREPMAQRAEAENMSLRKLQGEVDGLRKLLKVSERDAEKGRRQVDVLTGQVDKLQQQRTQLKQDADILLAEKQALQVEREALKEMVRDLTEEAKSAPATGISAEAQAEIDRLQGELNAADARVEKQAELRQQAQQELLNFKAQAARGQAPRDEVSVLDEIELSTRTFLAGMSAVRYMTGRLRALSDRERHQALAHVDALAEWTRAMYDALDIIDLKEA